MLSENEKELIEKTVTRTGYSSEEVSRAFNNVKQAFVKAVEVVERIITNICDFLNQINNKKHEYNWKIPIKLNIPQAPFVKNYNLRFARNNL